MPEKRFPHINLKGIINFLIEKLCPFNVRQFQILVVIITSAALGLVLLFGWLSSKKVKDIVTEDFNQQQLVLAQYAARQIENSLNTLKKELSLLWLSPSIQYSEKVSMSNRIGITFSSIKEEGVLEIRYITSIKQTHVVDSHSYQLVQTYPEDLDYLKWAGEIRNKGNILMDEISPESTINPPIPPLLKGGKRGLLITKMAMPVWQVSVDESHPVATNKFSGVIVFVIDLVQLIDKTTKEIRSGKTGYAWVIDKSGIFLYHPEKDFIGKNAFEIRKEKKPAISFARINEIQREKMLKGKEGTSWYISGWHRGKESEMKKLIAFTPINLIDIAGDHIWSVAVAAPISEVEDAIHLIHIRQFWLQTIIVVVILLGSLTVITLMVNWSRTLEHEVERQTLEFKKSEQRYKSLVENAEDIIFTVDYNGNYLSINRYGAKVFNKEPEDIVGHNMVEILSCEGADLPLAMVKEVFNAKESRQITHSIRIGAQEYWFNTNLRRLWDKEGNIYAVLGISRDITERKKIVEQSYHTEKLASMGTLSAGVAHEINNPLALILGFTDLLLEKTDHSSQEYDMLKTIEKHGLHAKRVVQNLLSFARYSECKEEPVDINKSIEDVLDIAGNTLLANKITVKKQFDDALPLAKGCAEELEQVFLNIINNAVFAMTDGGILSIMTQALDDKVEIRFSDTGHGIKKDYRSRIFDPLFTTKKVGEGTGLGLSVSYGIITKYGGSITFETKTKEESEETGTTFIINLPAIKNVEG